ncbi:MAG: tetratricopeptide repeat protein [Myxococcota bacterium]
MAAASAPDASRRWLFGPVPDLLLGCGGAHVLLVLLFALPVVQQGVDPWLVLGAALISQVTNTPHYGATLLRVYEHRSERRRFALFSVWITLALIGLFVAGLHWALLGSILLTAYATWSPWHFSGQNYGLSLMLLRRRGVDVDAGTKRLFYASFLLSFALTALLLHTEAGTIALAPVPAAVSGQYTFLSLGLPDTFSRAIFPLLGGAYLAVVGATGMRLLREGGTLRDLAPAAALVATQALWFSFPALLRYMDAFTTENIAFGAFGVSIAHSVQYLWVTSYYAVNADRGERVGSFLGKTLLAGAAVVVFPALLFAPGLLGTVPFNAGLGILLFSVVNLHHFILDGAIWKLRDGPVARVLLRSPSEAAPAAEQAVDTRGPWRTAVFAAGALAFGVAVFHAFEIEFGINRALRSRDLARVDEATRHLRWIGRADYRIHQQLADALAQETWRRAVADGSAGRDTDFSDALAHYEESLRIYESAPAWLGLGNVRYTQGDYAGAREAYEAVLRVNPRHFRALNRLGELWLAQGDLVRARASLERAAALAPRDARIRTALERLAEAERLGG